ncbi:hypothetical protein KY289_008029 [Solanum tuberosum]|nr:hypothetical protein KY289_008029 [Solanum tuberosum]
MSAEEKIGGLPIYPHEFEEFSFYINFCDLFDVHVRGSSFTWWKGRADKACIFKRLDRVVTNQALVDVGGGMEVQHLTITGSDHAPLLFSCGGELNSSINLFKFLRFWTSRHDLNEIFRSN